MGKLLLYQQPAGGGAEGGAYAHHVDACGEAFEVEEVFILPQAFAAHNHHAVDGKQLDALHPGGRDGDALGGWVGGEVEGVMGE